MAGKNSCPGSKSPDTTSNSSCIPTHGRTTKAGKQLKIGVLALQGNFAKHIEMIERLGAAAVPVRLPGELDDVDGLVIPGGESTTVGKLMSRYGLDEAISRRVEEGLPIFGTCMGMIMLAERIEGSEQQRLGLMDITVRRNAFGRQVDSFETDLQIPELGEKPLRAVFIRAPFVTETGESTKVVAKLVDGRIVMVRQGNLLAAAFHPELTEDTRVHEFFLKMISGEV